MGVANHVFLCSTKSLHVQSLRNQCEVDPHIVHPEGRLYWLTCCFAKGYFPYVALVEDPICFFFNARSRTVTCCNESETQLVSNKLDTCPPPSFDFSKLSLIFYVMVKISSGVWLSLLRSSRMWSIIYTGTETFWFGLYNFEFVVKLKNSAGGVSVLRLAISKTITVNWRLITIFSSQVCTAYLAIASLNLSAKPSGDSRSLRMQEPVSRRRFTSRCKTIEGYYFRRGVFCNVLELVLRDLFERCLYRVHSKRADSMAPLQISFQCMMIACINISMFSSV